jgi:hypothetical protein
VSFFAHSLLEKYFYRRGTNTRVKCRIDRLLRVTLASSKTQTSPGGTTMDQDQRMQCLRMAIELGGKTEPIVSAAQQLLDFVHGKERQEMKTSAEPALDETPAVEQASAPAETAAAVEQSVAPAETSEPIAADAIAACGTAMVMPESGDLADAVPSLDAAEASPPAAAEPASQPEATTEQVAAAPAAEPASVDQPIEASVAETQSSELAPPTEEASEVHANENSPELSAAPDAASEPTPTDNTPRVGTDEATANEAARASSPSASSDGCAVTDPPAVSS